MTIAVLIFSSGCAKLIVARPMHTTKKTMSFSQILQTNLGANGCDVIFHAGKAPVLEILGTDDGNQYNTEIFLPGLTLNILDGVGVSTSMPSTLPSSFTHSRVTTVVSDEIAVECDNDEIEIPEVIRRGHVTPSEIAPGLLMNLPILKGARGVCFANSVQANLRDKQIMYCICYGSIARQYICSDHTVLIHFTPYIDVYQLGTLSHDQWSKLMGIGGFKSYEDVMITCRN